MTGGGPINRAVLADELRRHLATVDRHQRRSLRMPRLIRRIRDIRTALLEADLAAMTSPADVEPADAEDQDYYPRRRR